MSPAMKNILVVLAAFTVAFGGYYFYSQSKNASLNTGTVSLTEEMMLSTQVFIERRAILDQVRLDTSLFDDPVFRSYRSFREPLQNEPYGRSNPFNRVLPGETYLNI